MSYAQLELDVVRWAEARQIIKHSTPVAQARKTLEEAGELLEWTAMQAMVEEIAPDNESLKETVRHKVMDCYGDVLTTLIVGAACADVDLMECLQQALDEIKHRKGTLRADGVFVKESDER